MNPSSTLWFCPPVPKIQWVGSWLCKFPIHNTTCTCMMTSDEIIGIQMKGEKTLYFWQGTTLLKFFYHFSRSHCRQWSKVKNVLTHKRWNNIMLVLSWKIQHLKHWEIFQIILHIFLIWIYTTSKPFRI